MRSWPAPSAAGTSPFSSPWPLAALLTAFYTDAPDHPDFPGPAAHGCGRTRPGNEVDHDGSADGPGVLRHHRRLGGHPAHVPAAGRLDPELVRGIRRQHGARARGCRRRCPAWSRCLLPWSLPWVGCTWDGWFTGISPPARGIRWRSSSAGCTRSCEKSITSTRSMTYYSCGPPTGSPMSSPPNGSTGRSSTGSCMRSPGRRCGLDRRCATSSISR